MQSRKSNDTSAQMPVAVQPPVAVEESVDHYAASSMASLPSSQSTLRKRRRSTSPSSVSA
jgi:hypothetical protein